MVYLHNVFKCLLANKNEFTKEYLKSKIKGYLKRKMKDNIITNISVAKKLNKSIFVPYFTFIGV